MEGLRVGMLGCRAVGTGVAWVAGRARAAAAGTGPVCRSRCSGWRCGDVTRKRDPAVDHDHGEGGDAAAVVADPEVDVVVEVMGGSSRPGR